MNLASLSINYQGGHQPRLTEISRIHLLKDYGLTFRHAARTGFRSNGEMQWLAIKGMTNSPIQMHDML
jgi:hypothetical protein